MKSFGPVMKSAVFLLVAACATVPADDPAVDPTIVKELPEGVRAVVGPNQDLSVVRIKPEDGCYWYQWTGPVETTFLPLRTADGRMICTRENEPRLVGR